ncbi:MAG: phasin family protein [Motiliproteus sp.]
MNSQKKTDLASASYGSDELVTPFLQIADANCQAFEKVVELQTALFSSSIEASVKQFKVILDCCSDPQALTQSQLGYLQNIEHSLAETGEQEYRAIQQANETIEEIVSASTKHQHHLFSALYPYPSSPV